METSRSESVPERAPVDPADLNVSPDAPAETVAAIASAISAMRSRAAASAEESDYDEAGAWWRGRAWRMTGRFESIDRDPLRPVTRLPDDPWRAAGRLGHQ